MSYTELEHGYQGLKRSRPAFYIGLDLDSHLRHASVSRSFFFFHLCGRDKKQELYSKRKGNPLKKCIVIWLEIGFNYEVWSLGT